MPLLGSICDLACRDLERKAYLLGARHALRWQRSKKGPTEDVDSLKGLCLLFAASL